MVRGDRRGERVVVEPLEVRPREHPGDVDADVAADLGCDHAVVAVMIFTAIRARAASAMAAPASALGRSTKVRNPRAGGRCSSAAAWGRCPGAVVGRDGDDPGAVLEQALEHRLGLGRTSAQRAIRASGAPLVTRMVRRPGPRRPRCELPLVVERQVAETRVHRAARPAPGAASPRRATARRRGRCRPPGRRPTARLVAEQPEQQRARSAAPPVVERLVEGDRAFGERPGLVGEQHLDVAEILDRHEPLDQHPLARERAATRSRGSPTRSPAAAGA